VELENEVTRFGNGGASSLGIAAVGETQALEAKLSVTRGCTVLVIPAASSLRAALGLPETTVLEDLRPGLSVTATMAPPTTLSSPMGRGSNPAFQPTFVEKLDLVPAHFSVSE
jgi:hypothetical protein